MSNGREYILPDGKKVTGTPVDVVDIKGGDADLTLADGSCLKLKLAVMFVEKVPEHDLQGMPMYAVTSQVVPMVISAPEHLKKQST